ncbi:MAG TPA: hypothetical protein VIM51_10170 [Desulfosporosinus sp.]
MAKAILETSLEINLNICTDEIVYSGAVVMRDQCQVKKICTKKVNDVEAIPDAHLEGLTEYNLGLVEMKARVAEVQDDLKEEYLSQVENLENIRNLFAIKYVGRMKSSGNVWDDLKVATEEAWSELEFY